MNTGFIQVIPRVCSVLQYLQVRTHFGANPGVLGRRGCPAPSRSPFRSDRRKKVKIFLSPDRGLTPSGSSTNLLYRAVFSRGYWPDIMHRFDFVLNAEQTTCTHTCESENALGKLSKHTKPIRVCSSLERVICPLRWVGHGVS